MLTTSWGRSGIGERSTTPLINAKMAELTPIARARVKTATLVNPGDLRSWRKANLKSWIMRNLGLFAVRCSPPWLWIQELARVPRGSLIVDAFDHLVLPILPRRRRPNNDHRCRLGGRLHVPLHHTEAAGLRAAHRRDRTVHSARGRAVCDAEDRLVRARRELIRNPECALAAIRLREVKQH